MAWPGESENVDYLKYLEEYDLGEHEGPRMTKDQWRQKRKPQKTMEDLIQPPEKQNPYTQR